MANKRRSAAARKPKEKLDEKRNPKREPKTGIGSKALQEAIAVLLGCAGLLTLLALASYTPSDASLNASGSAEVKNWIGPAGAYWADMLLQLLGVGAYALAFGALLASWRAFAGKRVRPGLREAAGTALMVICVGAFAHLIMYGHHRPYPAGGVVGAILAQVLLEKFARVGAYVLSSALVMTSVTLTADGVLSGLGLPPLPEASPE